MSIEIFARKLIKSIQRVANNNLANRTAKAEKNARTILKIDKKQIKLLNRFF